MTKLNWTYKQWHAWQGVAAVLLSDELTKTLREFRDVDHAINWLYFVDRDAARDLNRAKGK